MSDVETELAAAIAALVSADDEQALERLVAAWGHARAAALIPLVDALADRVEARARPLGGKTVDERYVAFRATAAHARQADLARLVGVLPRLRFADIARALDRLAALPPTPRMRVLLDAVRLPGYTKRVDEVSARHAEPAAVTLSARARAQLAELSTLLLADDAGDALLAQVYADPEADAPRLVYADWATSRGDPRGELISLQFARRDRSPDAAAVRRERELIAQYMHRWLAPIWNVIRAHSVRFERGFLAGVTVEPFAEIVARPEWATVVALELAYHDALPLDAFPALRELRNVTPTLLAQIADAPRPLVHLGMAPEPGAGPYPPVLPALVHPVAFPALASLGVWGRPEDWAWLWGTRLAPQVTCIEVTRDASGVSPWLEATLPSTIRTLRFRDGTLDARFARAGDVFTRLEVRCREAPRAAAAGARSPWLAWVHALDLAPAGTIGEVRFIAPRKLRADNLARLERIVRDRHPTLQRFAVDVDPFV